MKKRNEDPAMKQTVNGNIIPGLGNIKRIVVLMFENRSFDHLFGAFPGANGLFKDGQINQDYYNLPDPLSPPSETNVPVYPSPIDPSKPQPHDFTHDFGDGMMPDLFGPVFTVTDKKYKSGYSNGILYGVQDTLPTTYPKTNSGFYTTYNNNKQQEQSALTYFEYKVPRILHELASEFVLCDNWHCDFPGHTNPNRAFMHCAQNYNGIDDPDSPINGQSTVTSVFDRIANTFSEDQFNMYVPVDYQGNMGQNDFSNLYGDGSKYNPVPLTQFALDCKNDTLPFYSFIMCWLPSSDAYTDTSMHPNALIQPGENLLAAVYNTLRNSPCWDDTLLVVNFDENGGLYDHVFPPTTTPPIANVAPIEQMNQGCCGNKWQLDSKFDFSLLGLRVPALLISPWLSKGIDNTQYQNTSALKFVIDTMNEQYKVQAPYLTQRDATAPSLNSAFNQFGQNTMRQDCPETIMPYTTIPCIDPNTGSNAIPYSCGFIMPWLPPKGMNVSPPVPYINELLNIYMGGFPGHSDSDKRITREFKTNDEVKQYTREREQAAEKYSVNNNKSV